MHILLAQADVIRKEMLTGFLDVTDPNSQRQTSLGEGDPRVAGKRLGCYIDLMQALLRARPELGKNCQIICTVIALQEVTKEQAIKAGRLKENLPVVVTDLHDALVLVVLFSPRRVSVLPEGVERGLVKLLRKFLLHQRLNPLQGVVTDALKNFFCAKPVVNLDDNLSDGIRLEFEGRRSRHSVGDVTFKRDQRNDALVAGVDGTVVTHNLEWSRCKLGELLQLPLFNDRDESSKRLLGLNLGYLGELVLGDHHNTTFGSCQLVTMDLGNNRLVRKPERMVRV